MSVASGVGTLVVVVVLLGGALAAGRVADTSQRAAGGADAAALAAADTLSGRLPGVACDAAADVAARNGTSVTACTTDGAIATVTVVANVMGVEISATARAGPPTR